MLSPVLAALLCLTHPVAGHSKTLHPDYQLLRGEMQQYGDWLVGCDNQGACTMLGFPGKVREREHDATVSELAIRISLAEPTGTEAVVELVPFGSEADRSKSTDGPFVLNLANDPAVWGLPRGYSHQLLDPAQARAVIRHLGGDKPLLGIALSTNRAVVRFPQDQFTRAFRAMHSRRNHLLEQRADEAIDTLPGELPDGSTMPVPSKLKRIPAVETIVSGFVPILAAGRCRNAFMDRLHQYHFANGAILWSFQCSSTPGSAMTLWDMAPSANALAAPLDLPEPRDGKVRAGADGLAGVTFDWDFGILRSYEYLDGREDCGVFRAWGYTGNGWHMIERREMPLCKGLDPTEWIRTHYTPTEGTGPDE